MNALLTLNRFLPIASSRPRHARRKKLRLSSFGRKLNIESLEGRAVPASLAVDFATLDNFAVLGLNGSKMDITNPQTHIGGNVGLAGDSNQNFSDGQISGSLVVDPSADNTKSNNVEEADGVVTTNLSAANAAAFDASSQIAAMTPTQEFD